MLNLKQLTGTLLLAVLAASCTSSVHPISPLDAAYYDEDLIGTWVGRIEDEEAPIWLHFHKAKNSMTQGVIVLPADQKKGESEGVEVGFIEVYPSKVGNSRYLNIKPFLPKDYSTPEREKEYQEANFELVKYGISAGTMKIWMLNGIDPFIESGALQGERAKGMYGSPTITASTEDLAEFLKTADHDKVFKLLGIFRKVEIPSTKASNAAIDD